MFQKSIVEEKSLSKVRLKKQDSSRPRMKLGQILLAEFSSVLYCVQY